MPLKTKDRTGPRGTGLSRQYDEAASQWSHHCSCSGHWLPAYNLLIFDQYHQYPQSSIWISSISLIININIINILNHQYQPLILPSHAVGGGGQGENWMKSEEKVMTRESNVFGEEQNIFSNFINKIINNKRHIVAVLCSGLICAIIADEKTIFSSQYSGSGTLRK